MTRPEQLIHDIEVAFATVERGAGLTLHEAVTFEGNDYWTTAERARVRALDPETRWQEIPDSALEECEDRWGCDEAGVRYHLPAYMRWHLRHSHRLAPHHGGLIYWFLWLRDQKQKDRARWERSWDNYSLEQKRAIARFLEFMARESPQLGHHPHIAELAAAAWKSYWFKFSQPGLNV